MPRRKRILRKRGRETPAGADRAEEIEEALKGHAPPRRRGRKYVCTICEREFPFCHACACGFTICPGCFEENAWGLTCNNITWECPRCGGMRSF